MIKLLWFSIDSHTYICANRNGGTYHKWILKQSEWRKRRRKENESERKKEKLIGVCVCVLVPSVMLTNFWRRKNYCKTQSIAMKQIKHASYGAQQPIRNEVIIKDTHNWAVTPIKWTNVIFWNCPIFHTQNSNEHDVIFQWMRDKNLEKKFNVFSFKYHISIEFIVRNFVFNALIVTLNECDLVEKHTIDDFYCLIGFIEKKNNEIFIS